MPTMQKKMRPIVTKVVHVGVVYATTGVVGLSVMAWMAFRARRTPAADAAVDTEDEPRALTAA